MRSRLLTTLVFIPAAALAQSRPDLFRCEGCESIHEHAFDNLKSTTTIAGPGEPGERLVLTGRVVKPDGKTPAAGVVVYVHHTNAKGVYPMRGDETGWGRRHGYLRGWIKTGPDGEYRFETIRPAPYTGMTDPAHIHFIIKEPDRREYWIDDVWFTDDPLVTPAQKARLEHRGGPGLVTPRQELGVWLVRRDIVLER